MIVSSKYFSTCQVQKIICFFILSENVPLVHFHSSTRQEHQCKKKKFHMFFIVLLSASSRYFCFLSKHASKWTGYIKLPLGLTLTEVQDLWIPGPV